MLIRLGPGGSVGSLADLRRELTQGVVSSALLAKRLRSSGSVRSPTSDVRERALSPVGSCGRGVRRFFSHSNSERIEQLNQLKLSAMDASARVPMKDAAKCDTHCELQNSVNQQISERNLRLGACP